MMTEAVMGRASAGLFIMMMMTVMTVTMTTTGPMTEDAVVPSASATS